MHKFVKTSEKCNIQVKIETQWSEIKKIKKKQRQIYTQLQMIVNILKRKNVDRLTQDVCHHWKSPDYTRDDTQTSL